MPEEIKFPIACPRCNYKIHLNDVAPPPAPEAKDSGVKTPAVVPAVAQTMQAHDVIQAHDDAPQGDGDTVIATE